MEQEKLIEVLKDKTFVEKILKLKTPVEVQAAFKEKDIEISIKDVQILGSLINKLIEKGKSELSEDELKEVAGGFGHHSIFSEDSIAYYAGALTWGALVFGLSTAVGAGLGFTVKWALKEN